MDNSITDRIHQLLSQGETEAAIIELTDWAKASQQPDWVKQCILVRARWEQLQRENAAGKVDDEDLRLQTNQINSAVLDLLDHAPPEQPVAAARRRTFLWTGLAILGVLVFAGLLFLQYGPGRGGTARISWPEGKKTSLSTGSGDIATYQILSASVETFDPENNKLTLDIRCSNESRYSINFWDANFRFRVADAPDIAPQSDLNEIVEGRSFKDGRIWFIIPKGIRKGQLEVRFTERGSHIPIEW